MAITYKSPKSLIPYSSNPKSHPPNQVNYIVRLIEKFGFPDSKAIGIDENNIIIYGHGRAMAAIQAGLPRVPVEVFLGMSEEDKKAWRIADNRSQETEWINELLDAEIASLQDLEYDMDLLEFTIEQIEKNFKESHKEFHDLPPIITDDDNEGEGISNNANKVGSSSGGKLFVGIMLTSSQMTIWNKYKESVGLSDDSQAFCALLFLNQ